MFPDHQSFIDPLRHVPRSCRRSVTRGGSRHLAGRRPVRDGTPVGHGESLPAPERTVEGHDRHELVALCAGEVELGRKELQLGLEDLIVIRDAVIVALERKRDRRLERRYRLGSLGGRPRRAESWFSLTTIWRSSSGMPARAWVSAAVARDTSSSVPIPPT